MAYPYSIRGNFYGTARQTGSAAATMSQTVQNVQSFGQFVSEAVNGSTKHDFTGEQYAGLKESASGFESGPLYSIPNETQNLGTRVTYTCRLNETPAIVPGTVMVAVPHSKQGSYAATTKLDFLKPGQYDTRTLPRDYKVVPMEDYCVSWLSSHGSSQQIAKSKRAKLNQQTQADKDEIVYLGVAVAERPGIKGTTTREERAIINPTKNNITIQGKGYCEVIAAFVPRLDKKRGETHRTFFTREPAYIYVCSKNGALIYKKFIGYFAEAYTCEYDAFTEIPPGVEPAKIYLQ